MRVSELSGKEVINLGDGGRLGTIDDCELSFDARTGRIDALLLPAKNSMFRFFETSRGTVVPWEAIKRIGDEVVIVDLSSAVEKNNISTFRERKFDAY